MGLPPAEAMVRLWERGRSQHPIDRALSLLELAEPATPRDELATLTIGERDRRLLGLRQELFGDPFNAQTDCPGCGERLEFEHTVSSFRIDGVADLAGRPLVVESGDLVVEIRSPDSRDLAAAARRQDLDRARQTLFDRCVTDLRRDGEPVQTAELPDEVLTEIARALAERDPQADVQLDLACPSCGHAWQQAFDVSAYLWSEVSDRARRLLEEVHTLAWAYGWSEEEILSLSDARRLFYLESVERWSTS